MTFDLNEPKTIQCGDSITVRIPGSWHVNGNEEKGWYCDEDDGNEIATLWISLLRSPTPIKSEFDPRTAVEQYIAFRTREDASSIHASTLTQDNGLFRWTYFLDSDDRGVQIRNSFHTIFRFSGDKMAAVVFNLVVVVSRINDPDVCDLVAFVDRELRAAAFEPFSTGPRDGIYAGLRRVNFNGQIAMVLPDTFDIRAEEENEWSCVFDPDVLKARMTVKAIDHRLADDDGNPVKPDRAILAYMVEQLVGDTFDRSRAVFYPDGILYYEECDASTDDVEVPCSWGALHGHHWRYFKREDWRVRQAQFSLIVPSDSDADIEEFVAFIAREVRRADFPDDTNERAQRSPQ